MNVILGKAALACAAGIALAGTSLLLPRIRPSALAAGAGFDVPLLWLLTRLFPIIGLYVILRQAPQSDVATCFWPQAEGAFSGRIPYRDFESFFSPLFPYLLAFPLLFWRDPRVLIVWMSVLEAATIALTARASGLGSPGPRRARFLACAFLAPGPFLLCVIGGQEDFLVWSFGLLVWLAARRGRDATAGGAAAAGMLLTKPLFLLPLAGFVGIVRSRARFLTVLLTGGIASAAGLWVLTRTKFLMTLGQSHNISPPNIWILLHFLSAGRIPAGGPAIAFAALALLLVGALAVGAGKAAVLRSDFRMFGAGWTLLFALLMLLSPKSEGAYLANFALPCLAWMIDRPGWIALWVLLGGAGVVESSLFYRFGEALPAGWRGIAGRGVLADLGLQALEVAALIAFAAAAYRALFRPDRPAAS